MNHEPESVRELLSVQRPVARWTSRLAIAVMLLAGVILVFLLVAATNNRLLYERYYVRLLSLNVVVASVLAVVILWGLYRLISRLREGKFGSRLLLKLAAIFMLVGVLPGLFVYTVSYQFVSRSIESWFDVKVEGALASGLTLARTSIDAQARDFSNQVRAAAEVLSEVPDSAAAIPLERLRLQLGAQDAVLWTAEGRLVASTGRSRFELAPQRPPRQLLREVTRAGLVTQVDGMDDALDAQAVGASGGRAHIRSYARVRAKAMGLLTGPRVLEAVQALPPGLVEDALAVQEANREYQERALGREGLRRMYIGTLTLSLFLAVFSAVVLAVLLGKQLATPLLVLAHGVRQVAAGDLRPKLISGGRDELGGLTRSFAQMTQQLADARAAVDKSMREVTAARTNLQTILDNLTAGVIVLDSTGLIQSANPGATRILRAPLAAALGQPLDSIPRLSDFAHAVRERFADFEEVRPEHGLDHWQQSFDLYGNTEGANSEVVSLVARGAGLPGGMRLLVFDDISEIVSAQRTEAWAEVARRLAHEIKNPLTPIRLSAERLERRLDGKLPESEQAVLTKSVRTIVDQVEAMKRLVNEFREYARLPTAKLEPLDLNDLVADILHLYESNELSEAGTLHALRFDPDPRCPSILGDPQQLRQVVHNLVQNALDATASTPEPVQPDGEAAVLVRTRWSRKGQRVHLVISDHGPGFPDNILKRAFEPYVTTKSKGTGLGLPMVKKIMDEHHARIDVANRVFDGRVDGAQVSLTFDPAPTDGGAA